MQRIKSVIRVGLMLAVGMVAMACASGGSAANPETAWEGKISKPDHLDGNFRYEPDPRNPAVFNFVNVSMGRAEYEAVLQKVLADLASLNAKPYSYEDLFARFGPPSRILVFKAGNVEHLNWYYGPIDFYIGPKGMRVMEARFEEDVPGFSWLGLHHGDPIEMIGDTIGPVKETVDGKIEWGDQVLYTNYDGKKGNGYFANNQKGVRVFAWDNKISAIYIFPIAVK